MGDGTTRHADRCFIWCNTKLYYKGALAPLRKKRHGEEHSRGNKR